MTVERSDDGARAVTFAERQMDTMLVALQLHLGPSRGAAAFLIAALRTVARIRNQAANPAGLDGHIARTFRDSVQQQFPQAG